MARLIVALLISSAAAVVLAIGMIGGAALAQPPPPAKRAPAPRGDRETLAAHRAQQLARLHEYATQGKFPRNFTSQSPVHLFKDGEGRLCAVANLVHQDGLDDLVDATARGQNGVVLADVTQGRLHEWALGSGLTMEEIARIQAPSPFVQTGRNLAARPSSEQRMIATLRAHFSEVEAELASQEQASLDVATARLQASRASMASSM
jgi:hypothetical protein